jgi:hypothetical protein
MLKKDESMVKRGLGDSIKKQKPTLKNIHPQN